MAEIFTTEDGLEAQNFRLQSEAGETWAYFAKPIFGADLPIMLIAEEIFGLNDHIRDIARRFAHAGYFALAPDFLGRYGDVANAPDFAAIREIVAKVPDRATMEDFDAALKFAASHGGDAARAAAVGFCWGGRIVWLYAAHNASLRAAVPLYGRLDGERSDVNPKWPVDIAKELKVPTLGLYGGADASIPPAQIEAMRAKLKEGGAPAEIHVYDDAPHAFFADYRESYREGPAQDAFRRMLEFFHAHGAG